MRLHQVGNLHRIVVGLLSLMPLAAPATEAQLTDDAHVTSAAPASNYGALPTLNISPSSAGLLKFNLGILPTGTTQDQIAKAMLYLWVNKVGVAGAIDIEQASVNWAEGSVTANTAPGVSASIATAVPVSAAGKWVSVDLTGAVKQWVEHPDLNYGLSVMANDASPATVFLDSKENTATSHPARLEIVLGTQGATSRIASNIAEGTAQCQYQARRIQELPCSTSCQVAPYGYGCSAVCTQSGQATDSVNSCTATGGEAACPANASLAACAQGTPNYDAKLCMGGSAMAVGEYSQCSAVTTGSCTCNCSVPPSPTGGRCFCTCTTSHSCVGEVRTATAVTARAVCLSVE